MIKVCDKMVTEEPNKKSDAKQLSPMKKAFVGFHDGVNKVLKSSVNVVKSERFKQGMQNFGQRSMEMATGETGNKSTQQGGLAEFGKNMMNSVGLNLDEHTTSNKKVIKKPEKEVNVAEEKSDSTLVKRKLKKRVTVTTEYFEDEEVKGK